MSADLLGAYGAPNGTGTEDRVEAIEVVLQQHATVHSAESPGGDASFSLQDLILGGLSNEQLRCDRRGTRTRWHGCSGT